MKDDDIEDHIEFRLFRRTLMNRTIRTVKLLFKLLYHK